MFTGIIEEIGKVKEVNPRRLVLTAEKVLKGMNSGDSIAVNGVCLTVTSSANDSFSVDIMAETCRRTNLGKLHYSDLVNLERALMLGSRMGGHIVQGHVDGMGKVISMLPDGEAVIMRISIPSELSFYTVPKGSIAIDGVSLTIVDCGSSSLSVSLVDYTLQHTTLGNKKPGNMVNLEVDVIAKYMERFKQRNKYGLTLEFLAKHGFSEVG